MTAVMIASPSASRARRGIAGGGAWGPLSQPAVTSAAAPTTPAAMNVRRDRERLKAPALVNVGTQDGVRTVSTI